MLIVLNVMNPTNLTSEFRETSNILQNEKLKNFTDLQKSLIVKNLIGKLKKFFPGIFFSYLEIRIAFNLRWRDPFLFLKRHKNKNYKTQH